MSGVRLSRLASKDLDEIWPSAASTETVDFASRLIDEITDRFPILAGMPESGRLRPEIKPDIRSFPVGDFIIYYLKAKRGGIQVWRVVHANRDQFKALRVSKPRGLR
jgi:toxin ParE1/3/4